MGLRPVLERLEVSTAVSRAEAYSTCDIVHSKDRLIEIGAGIRVRCEGADRDPTRQRHGQANRPADLATQSRPNGQNDGAESAARTIRCRGR